LQRLERRLGDLPILCDGAARYAEGTDQDTVRIANRPTSISDNETEFPWIFLT
jgi:hypothetical protein